ARAGDGEDRQPAEGRTDRRSEAGRSNHRGPAREVEERRRRSAGPTIEAEPRSLVCATRRHGDDPAREGGEGEALDRRRVRAEKEPLSADYSRSSTNGTSTSCGAAPENGGKRQVRIFSCTHSAIGRAAAHGVYTRILETRPLGSIVIRRSSFPRISRFALSAC